MLAKRLTLVFIFAAFVFTEPSYSKTKSSVKTIKAANQMKIDLFENGKTEAYETISAFEQRGKWFCSSRKTLEHKITPTKKFRTHALSYSKPPFDAMESIPKGCETVVEWSSTVSKNIEKVCYDPYKLPRQETLKDLIRNCTQL